MHLRTTSPRARAAVPRTDGSPSDRDTRGLRMYQRLRKESPALQHQEGPQKYQIERNDEREHFGDEVGGAAGHLHQADDRPKRKPIKVAVATVKRAESGSALPKSSLGGSFAARTSAAVVIGSKTSEPLAREFCLSK